MIEKQPVEDHVKTFLGRWHRQAYFHRSLSVILGIVTIIASLLIAAFTSELGTFWTKTIAIIGASTLGILEAFQISEKANGFRQAYRHLYIAYYFRYIESKNIDELRKAFEEAIEMIGKWSLKIGRPPGQTNTAVN